MRTELHIRILLTLGGVKVGGESQCILHSQDHVLVSLCCPTITGSGENLTPGSNFTLQDHLEETFHQHASHAFKYRSLRQGYKRNQL